MRCSTHRLLQSWSPTVSSALERCARTTISYGFDNTLNPGVHVIVLPDHHERPSRVCQSALGVGVTSHVPGSLCGPVPVIGGRWLVVLGAAMPEAAAYLNGDLGPGEDEVGRPAYLRERTGTDAVSETHGVKGSPHS
jgi:hypothetical protein